MCCVSIQGHPSGTCHSTLAVLLPWMYIRTGRQGPHGRPSLPFAVLPREVSLLERGRITLDMPVRRFELITVRLWWSWKTVTRPFEFGPCHSHLLLARGKALTWKIPIRGEAERDKHKLFIAPSFSPPLCSNIKD